MDCVGQGWLSPTPPWADGHSHSEVPLSVQGGGRGAVPEPDGAAGRALRGAGGADADGAVPHAPGHHGMGVLGALRRPAQRTPLRGTAPAQVGHWYRS